MLLLLSDVFQGSPSAREDAPTTVAEEGGARLRATERRRKPVPMDAVEAVVVSKDRQEPLEGIEVRLRPSLGAAEGDEGARARTDAEGRARVSGELPGFLEVVSEAWDASPPIAPVEGGREARFELVPKTTYRATLLDATTGLPLSDWRLSAAGGPADVPAPRTDGQGSVAWPGLVRPPTLVAVSDGRRRVQSFLLYPLASRTEIRLAMPAAARTTRIRVEDGDRHRVPGARVHVIGEATGVTIDLDDRGEGELEYGARDGVAVTVTAPGFVRRNATLDGQPELTVALLGAVTRTFRVRKPDGTDVPDGTRVKGTTRGPSAYGAEGPGLEFSAPTEAGLARVPDAPATRFEGWIEAVGPGVDGLVRFTAGDDPAAIVELVAGPPRRLTVRVAHGAAEGGPAEPWTGLVLVHGPVSGGTCREDAATARRALDDVLASGHSGEVFATIVARLGPELSLTWPTCAEARALQLGGPGGEYACMEVAPGGDVALEARMAPALPREEALATTLLVEWEDGVPAALVELEVRRDEAGAPLVRAVTDSSGTALLRETTGRFTVAATRADGGRFAGDGPLLLPAPGVPLVKLKPVGP